MHPRPALLLASFSQRLCIPFVPHLSHSTQVTSLHDLPQSRVFLATSERESILRFSGTSGVLHTYFSSLESYCRNDPRAFRAAFPLPLLSQMLGSSFLPNRAILGAKGIPLPPYSSTPRRGSTFFNLSIASFSLGGSPPGSHILLSPSGSGLLRSLSPSLQDQKPWRSGEGGSSPASYLERDNTHTILATPGVPFLQPVSSASNFLPVTPALRRPLGAPSRLPHPSELTVGAFHH